MRNILQKCCIQCSTFNTALTVPDGESAVQIKNRVKAKVQNPYNAGALKAKIRKEARETAKTEAMCEAQPQVFESIVGEGSAVASITARVPPKVAPMDPHLVSQTAFISSGSGPNLRLRPNV